jgi:hypothetical protein
MNRTMGALTRGKGPCESVPTRTTDSDHSVDRENKEEGRVDPNGHEQHDQTVRVMGQQAAGPPTSSGQQPRRHTSKSSRNKWGGG